ncbi:hypothetical protein LTS18_005966 [Coniosporium uncinatum]|uniref:Uncharacterized protein n=1 Tax=Coniosporium uncinatum TaxID=93489 RepID=A0ACC3D429_9PEZI|nr:hypothetical protein LTS18_005966 [Coniosporium uncinatum]
MSSRASPWLKRVLIPFWTIRILLTLILLALYGLALAGASMLEQDYDSNKDAYSSYLSVSHRRRRITSSASEESFFDNDPDFGALFAVLGAFIGVTAIALILDITAIILFCKQNLQPKTFLILNCVQTTLCAVIFALSASGLGSGGVFVFIFTIVTLAVFVGLLIYASVVYHRSRKERGAYVRAKDAAGEVEAQTVSYGPYPYPSPYQP